MRRYIVVVSGLLFSYAVAADEAIERVSKSAQMAPAEVALAIQRCGNNVEMNICAQYDLAKAEVALEPE